MDVGIFVTATVMIVTALIHDFAVTTGSFCDFADDIVNILTAERHGARVKKPKQSAAPR